MSRPTVSIASAEGARLDETIPLPAVFKAPIRPDIVQYARQQVVRELQATLTSSQNRPCWYGEEQETTICRERESWSSDLC